MSVNGFGLFYLDYSDFIFEVDFSVTYFMTSAENSVWEPPNPLGEGSPRPPYKVLVILAPVTQNLATALMAQVGLLRADSQRSTTHQSIVMFSMAF